MIDLRRFVDDTHEIIRQNNLGRAGEYSVCRRPVAKPAPGSNPNGLNEYGVADAANLLYTIGRFPAGTSEREAWIRVLRNMQNPQTGLYHEASHHDYHCTAHCIAALELFDARPLHPLRALHPLLQDSNLETFLDQLDWKRDPWSQSHQGAGAFAAMLITREAPLHWQDRYFDWLWRETDPVTGYLRRGCQPRLDQKEMDGLFPHLAGTFHYLFNMQACKRPLRYPERMIDTTLEIRARNLCSWLGRSVSYAEIDWVYCITRPLRQCGHRFGDCTAALRDFAKGYCEFLLGLDMLQDPRTDNLHALFGVMCCLAELQAALPGELRTDYPLRLPLDRRPFI